MKLTGGTLTRMTLDPPPRDIPEHWPMRACRLTETSGSSWQLQSCSLSMTPAKRQYARPGEPPCRLRSFFCTECITSQLRRTPAALGRESRTYCRRSSFTVRRIRKICRRVSRGETSAVDVPEPATRAAATSRSPTRWSATDLDLVLMTGLASSCMSHPLHHGEVPRLCRVRAADLPRPARHGVVRPDRRDARDADGRHPRGHGRRRLERAALFGIRRAGR